MTVIHLGQASLRFDCTEREVRDDLDDILDRRPDAVGFTEVVDGRNRPWVVDAAKRHGYHVKASTPGESAILVAPEHEVLRSGARFAHDGIDGEFRPRWIDWVEFDFGGTRVFLHEAHWVNDPDTDRRRRRYHEQMTRAMIDLVNTHGEGDAVAFFAGDTNIDEATDRGAVRWMPHHLFTHARLRTIYDDLHEYPNTHGNTTIDVIGARLGDPSVTAKRVRVWPQGHSDHRVVSAWYDIKQ